MIELMHDRTSSPVGQVSYQGIAQWKIGTASMIHHLWEQVLLLSTVENHISTMSKPPLHAGPSLAKSNEDRGHCT